MVAHADSPRQSENHEYEIFGGAPPNNPQPLPVLLDQIPDELRAVPRWVTWRYGEPRPGGSRAKVPHCPRTGDRADVTRSDTWAPYSIAAESYLSGRYDGIGVVLAGDGLCGIDLDHVRHPVTGDLDPWAEEVVAAVRSYGEVSPSGTGLRLLAYGDLPDGRRRRGPVEVYDRARYLTITGHRLDSTPPSVERRPDEVSAVWRRLVAQDGTQDSAGRPTAPIGGLDDAELLRRACAARNGSRVARLWAGDWSGYPSQSEADLALCRLLAWWTGPDSHRLDSLMRQSGLCRAKWTERVDYRRRTIGRALASLSQGGYTPPASDPYSGSSSSPPHCVCYCAPNPEKWTFQVDGNWQTKEIAKQVKNRVRARRGLRPGALAERRLLVLVELLGERHQGRPFPLATRWAAEVVGTTETTARRAIHGLVTSGRLVRVAGDAERRRARLADEYRLNGETDNG